MSIRIKMLLSFTGMVVISLLFVLFTASLYTIAATGDLQSFRDIYKVHYQVNPLTDQGEAIFQELKYTAKNSPDDLQDVVLLREYDMKLRVEKSGLFVRRESHQIFESLTFNQPELGRALPPYDLNNNQIRSTFNISERFYAYAKFDFTFSDGERGSVFVIRERSPVAELTRKLLPVMSLLLIGVLIVTNLLLYRWITRSFIKPLNQLKDSAERIKEGNLAFQLKRNSNDEVGQLSEAFESMRNQLQRSNELRKLDEQNRKELISNISHDLRTPITNIKGYIEGIRDGVANTPEKMESYVNIIHAKAVSMDKLVDELFLYSKLDLNQEPFLFKTVDIVDFLEDSIEELRYDMEGKGVVFGWFNHAAGPVMASVDLDKLQRTVVNIVDNALKYMETDGQRRFGITLDADSEWITMAFMDNGKGIPEEALPHIFERFYRTEPSRNSATGGSGLGLAIARQIIDGHGGLIWAESEKGAGTTIFIQLKRLTEEEVRHGESQHIDH
ncbi:HAMP domain-containing sensor histidine kinase [Paenibacillus sp. JJ-223]|uniref:sensor histidine kinase n=1 Tax=Paenibacillus sp. JJ-223 TaxID=2905647 RepID=UPI001F42C5BA|nr:HAMP domain-containing sensor histidine kinase [Paenibacillus sp. JJ-223]CAH1198767.1 Adaptive-response sensory-kinase SasA [Paenibacillus sp. JJ-223]